LKDRDLHDVVERASLEQVVGQAGAHGVNRKSKSSLLLIIRQSEKKLQARSIFHATEELGDTTIQQP